LERTLCTVFRFSGGGAIYYYDAVDAGIAREVVNNHRHHHPRLGTPASRRADADATVQ
jgi:hypothetical protein